MGENEEKEEDEGSCDHLEEEEGGRNASRWEDNLSDGV
jgi:hypothetical protein